jgi:hypothetical protein
MKLTEMTADQAVQAAKFKLRSPRLGKKSIVSLGCFMTDINDRIGNDEDDIYRENSDSFLRAINTGVTPYEAAITRKELIREAAQRTKKAIPQPIKFALVTDENDVNWRDPKDRMRTRLHKTAFDNSLFDAKELIANGADPFVTDNHGWTALQTAMDLGGCDELVSYLRQVMRERRETTATPKVA